MVQHPCIVAKPTHTHQRMEVLVYNKHSKPPTRFSHKCVIPQGGIIMFKIILPFTVVRLLVLLPYLIARCTVMIAQNYIVHSVHRTYSLSVRSACCLSPTLVTLHSISQNTFVLAYNYDLPIPVAARSKAWVCCRSLAGTAGSNPVRRIDVCLASDVCCQVEVSATS